MAPQSPDVSTNRSEYAGDDDQLVTGEAVALDLRPAGFVLRAAGAAIDFAVTVLLLLGAITLLSSEALGFVVDEAAFAAITIALIVVLVVVVPTTVETLTHGKSLGKLAVGARIVRDDGGAIGFRHAFIRALTGMLEIVITFGGLAVLVALLNSRSKRLGDLLAGTYSQYERVPRIVEPTFPVPPRLEEWATTADVARLPDRLSRRVSQFIKQVSGMSPVARARVATELAGEVAQYVSPVPDAHPEELLLAITAVRREREFTALRLQEERMRQLEPVLGGVPHGFPDR